MVRLLVASMFITLLHEFHAHCFTHILIPCQKAQLTGITPEESQQHGKDVRAPPGRCGMRPAFALIIATIQCEDLGAQMLKEIIICCANILTSYGHHEDHDVVTVMIMMFSL